MGPLEGPWPQRGLGLGQPVVRSKMITLDDGDCGEPGEPGRLPPGTSQLPAELDGAPGMSASLLEPPGPCQPRLSAPVGGRKMEGEGVRIDMTHSCQ